MNPIETLHHAVLSGDAKTARRVTEEALQAGVPAVSLVSEAMVPAMNEAGRRF
ncbi:MAG: B12-binding domain-containing protein, partial [Verrucomicrobiales bacterium]|nr:B12-binding domain-containing protein [Verrucomicrobiales bacterium]